MTLNGIIELFAFFTEFVLHWGQALARGYFGARTAAATSAVVAQLLQQHPWLSAVDESVRFAMS